MRNNNSVKRVQTFDWKSMCVYIYNLYLYIHVAFVFGKESLKIPLNNMNFYKWQTLLKD